MGQNDDEVERRERLKQKAIGRSETPEEKVRQAKDLNSTRQSGEVTTETGGADVDTMLEIADIGDGPQMPETDEPSIEQEPEYAGILEDAADTFDYLAEGEFVDEKVSTFMLYDEFSGLYDVTKAIEEDEELMATSKQVFEWTDDMVETYELLENTESGMEYTEKGEKVYEFLE